MKKADNINTRNAWLLLSAFFLVLLFPAGLSAQLVTDRDQYVLNPLLINPAFAGERGALNVGTFYRMQWVGISGSPETLTFALDAPAFNNKVGFGLMMIRDQIGVTSETQIVSDYAYKIAIKEGTLSMGLSASLITTKTIWSDLIALDEGDEVYMIDSKNYYVPNFSFGLYYSNKNFYSGFSIPRFLNYKYNFDKEKYSLLADPSLYTYMFTSGYSIKLSKNTGFLPSFLISYPAGEKINYDLNAYFNFFDRFWIGASYRDKRSLNALFQLHIDKQLKVAYTYDFELGELGKYNNGSHGIMIRYTFSYKVDAVNPLIF